MAEQLSEKRIGMELIEVTVTYLIMGLSMLLIPFLALTIFKGMTVLEFFDKAVFYFGAGAIALVLLILLAYGKIIVERFPQAENYFGWLRGAMVFNPDIAFLGLQIPWFKKWGNQLKLGLTIFPLLALLSVAFKFILTAIPPQTVTTAADLFLAVEPASSAETMIAVLVISLIYGIIIWLMRKYTTLSNIINFAIAGIITTIIGGFLWMGYHATVYAGSEVDLFATFIFGFGGTFITVLTGNILLWWIWHFSANAAIKMDELFSTDTTLVVLVILYIFSDVFI